MFLKRNRAGLDFLVVGLGNPGKRYEQTRHNAGFWAVDAFAQKQDIRIARARFSALCGEGKVGGAKVLLMKPTTYMNLSGTAVQQAAAYYRLGPEQVVVICDDVSLHPGVIRIRAEGSAGGHNGVQSVIDMLQTQRFPRVKIGVGDRPDHRYELADWVTGLPSSADKKLIDARIDDVCDALTLIIFGNLTLAQSRYNG